GVAACMQALTLLRRLGLAPRRTIRVVLWTNEEFGLRGAHHYAANHAEELPHHVLAVEMDGGGFAPRGFSFEGADDATLARAADLATLLAPIGAGGVHAGHSGADVGALVERGVLGAGLEVDPTRYFDYHHTEADTLDKVDPADLALDVAALAVLAYVVADLPDRLGGPAAPAAP
ncbi:MAG TPA: M28 family peptidase, partial [Candidatus Limnocylindrales bacterium]